MKILEQTANKLVIFVKPLAWNIIPCLFISLGITSLLFSSNAQNKLLSCQRVEPTQVNCELSRSSHEKVWLNQVQEATIETSSGSEDETLYNITIFSKSVNVALLNGNTDDAARINNFLHNSQEPYFSIEYNNSFSFLDVLGKLFWLLILLGCIGVIWEVFVENTYTFDKTVSIFIHKRKSLRGVRIIEYPFAKVKEIIFEKQEASEQKVVYSVSLMVNEEEFPKLISVLSSSEQKKEAQELANTIAKFLNLSLTTKYEFVSFHKFLRQG